MFISSSRLFVVLKLKHAKKTFLRECEATKEKMKKRTKAMGVVSAITIPVAVTVGLIANQTTNKTTNQKAVILPTFEGYSSEQTTSEIQPEIKKIADFQVHNGKIQKLEMIFTYPQLTMVYKYSIRILRNLLVLS